MEKIEHCAVSVREQCSELASKELSLIPGLFTHRVNAYAPAFLMFLITVSSLMQTC